MDPNAPLDTVVNLVLEALHAGNWWLFIPGLVWLAVLLIRTYALGLVPWFGTKLGALTLTLALAVAGAFIDTAAGGAPWTPALVLGTFIKGVLMALGTIGINSAQKNAREGIAAPTTGTVASPLKRS